MNRYGLFGGFTRKEPLLWANHKKPEQTFEVLWFVLWRDKTKVKFFLSIMHNKNQTQRRCDHLGLFCSHWVSYGLICTPKCSRVKCKACLSESLSFTQTGLLFLKAVLRATKCSPRVVKTLFFHICVIFFCKCLSSVCLDSVKYRLYLYSYTAIKTLLFGPSTKIYFLFSE